MLKRLICWWYGHQMEWYRVPGRTGEEMMRGKCERCGETDTAFPPETPLPSELYPGLREFVRQHRLPPTANVRNQTPKI